jgi:hypothetical protein
MLKHKKEKKNYFFQKRDDSKLLSLLRFLWRLEVVWEILSPNSFIICLDIMVWESPSMILQDINCVSFMKLDTGLKCPEGL